MEDNKENEKRIEQNNEKNVDFKGTFANFLKDEEPEKSQEEAIRDFFENPKKKKNNNDFGEDDTTEEEEHYKRIKKELLDSLERVKKLEEKIYGQKEKEITAKKMKIKNNNGGMQGSQSIKNIEISNEQNKGSEREE